jgi:hypothetical protein
MKLRELIIVEDGEASVATTSSDIATVAYPLFVRGKNNKEKRKNARAAVGQKYVPGPKGIGQGVFEQQGVAEGNLKEFAPGAGGGESGRWYTDDQMTDIVGDGWWQDLDVSGNIPKQAMIQEAQAWLDDQGYNVQVLNCKLNDDDMEWYIEGSFQNSNFAKKGVAEGSSGMFSKVMSHETSPEAAKQIQQQGFKKSRTGIFFNVEGQNYSGGGYGGNVVMAKVSGPIDDILNLEDDNDLPDDLDDFADGEEIADYARSEGYWAWTDGVQFAVLDPRHIQVVKQGVGEAHVLNHDNVIYRLDRENPMSDTEVAVLGGAGRYSLKALRDKARREAAQLAQDLSVEHGGAFRRSADNIKQLTNTINTIVAAYNELARLRSKGGRGSRGITDEDTNFIRECIRVVEQATQNYRLLEGVAVEPDPQGYAKDQLTNPQYTVVVNTPGDLDWYKIGMYWHDKVVDPHEFGQDDSDTVMVAQGPEDYKQMLAKIKQMGLTYKTIGGTTDQPEIHSKTY